MRIQLALVLALGAGSLAAQTQIPIPPYSSTYSYSGHTRGFYFQAPIDFVISGLRVPDEQQHGLQNVEVIIMQSAPPTYTATASGGQVFYAVGVPSSQIIQTSIPCRTGEWVGVFGACGDASIMHNSYGAGSFPSSVLGAPITLERFLTQTNIVVSGGNGPYSGVGGSIARVEVYVSPACNGSVRLGGTGCADSGGVVNTLSYSGCPDLGTTLTLEFGTSASATGPLFLVFGASDQNWGGIVLPLDLTGFGAPGCFNYVSHEFVLGGLMPVGGQATLGLQIPSAPFLVGATSYLQGYHLNPGLNPLNLATTNYISATIG